MQVMLHGLLHIIVSFGVEHMQTAIVAAILPHRADRSFLQLSAIIDIRLQSESRRVDRRYRIWLSMFHQRVAKFP